MADSFIIQVIFPSRHSSFGQLEMDVKGRRGRWNRRTEKLASFSSPVLTGADFTRDKCSLTQCVGVGAPAADISLSNS